MTVDPVHDAVAFGDAGAAVAVETDGMNFVQIGKRPVFRCQIADPADRRDIAVHRVERFKDNHLRAATLCPRRSAWRFVISLVEHDRPTAIEAIESALALSPSCSVALLLGSIAMGCGRDGADS
jgi:hypothetical protein